MYTVKINFSLKQNKDTDMAEDAIYRLLGSLRMNGQILGREFIIRRKDLNYSVFAQLPETTSLDNKLANIYVTRELKNLEVVGLTFSFEIIGEELNCAPVCVCNSSESYILFTNYISIESPLRCGNCFGVIPLYKIPLTYDTEYYDILIWQSDYQACDSLQMNCSTGERFGIQQMSKHDSSLSKRGIEICNKISEITGIETYYYLFRYTSLGKKAELKRKCPSCSGEWLLNDPLHNKFDFKCDECRLLSNISWSVI